MCEKLFLQFSNLRKHEHIHIGVKPFKCNLCKKSFSRFGKLTTYKQAHIRVKPFKCDFCDKRFDYTKMNSYY